MFKNQLKKLTQKEEIKDEKTDKKRIENLAFLVIVLIITIVIINIIWNGNKSEKESNSTTSNKELAIIDENSEGYSNNETENDLENRLERILEKIDGVRRGKSTY
jgi:stage III sporulation protein AG